MASKTEYDHLVQTRITKGDYNWLIKRAKREGVSVAACLRRIVMRTRRERKETIPLKVGPLRGKMVKDKKYTARKKR